MEGEGANSLSGTWKNGPGVRYTTSSNSSRPYVSPASTPVNRAGQDVTDSDDRKDQLNLPSLSQDASQAKPKKKKKKDKTFSFDDDREVEKKRQRETEKFLQIYQDLHKIRDYFYDEYMVALRKKIAKQHKEIKEKDAARERIRQAKLEQQRFLSHHVRHRLQPHEFTHDEAYLKKIPKTELFKIVQLEDKLRKKGNLKYNCEVDEFWAAIRKNPSVFNYYLEKLNTDRGSQSLFRKRLNSAQKKALDRLEEEWFSDQPSSSPSPRSTPRLSPENKDSWAVTHMYSHQQKRSSSKGSRRASSTSPSKQGMSELDRRCPKMEMPDLYCFKMDLSRKLPDPLEMLQSAEIQAKDHERKKFLRQLNKMHQLATAHQAASDRILRQHEADLGIMFGGPDINDVIDVNFAIGKEGDDRLSTSDEGASLPEQPALPPITTNPQDQPPDNRQEDSLDVLSDKGTKALAVLPQTIPLTLEEVKDNCKIMEAKCTSVYWSNYLQARKPVAT